MPLFYKKEINSTTSLAVWKIEEPESFFLAYVPLSNNISHPHKRLQHLAGRYLLQYLCPDFPISSIQIADSRKPFLQDEKYHFSISHCGDYAAAIVSSTEKAGIDIELVRTTVSKIAHRFMHEEEVRHLLGLGLDTNLTANNFLELEVKLTELTLHWCAKEAIFKWWGMGDVNFREMIRIENFVLSDNGIHLANFTKDNVTYPLLLNHLVFDKICLVWLNGK